MPIDRIVTSKRCVGYTMTNPYAPPRAIVHDIAVATEDVVPADRWARLGASMLDAIIFGGMVYLPFLIGAIIGATAVGNDPDPEVPTAVLSIAGGIALVGLVIWCGFTFRLMKSNGQSIAKRIVGIKVVRSDGSPASLGRLIWMRNVLNWLISLIPLYGLVDSLFIFSESRQCLHDRIADTIVIKS
jgi:uncharacterized RDD family membrane protein YckC